ncbi:molybdenum cofactor sulfurase-like isoform X2 [Halichondria panicea]|uniref:molybdenum cofactor sulfurase-like isoform X2 n=1 Tax=Halichondria panicea TaxID=6063 RepID=UPI00312B5D15
MWVNCKQLKNGTVLDLAGWPLTLLRSLAHRLGVVFMKRWVWWSGPHTRAEQMQMEDGLQEREDILAARETEFAHTQGVTYLDHAGTTLYSSVQLQSYHSDLRSHLYGNPHSQNPSSKLSTDVIEQTREKVLNHFNTSLSQYDIVFTSGATGALNLLAESFPWTPAANIPELNTRRSTIEVRYLPNCKIYTGDSSNSQAANRNKDKVSTHTGSVFCYLEDNHTSVVGMRETAATRGASIVCTNPENIVTNPELSTATNLAKGKASNSASNSISTNSDDSMQPPLHLFVFPAQSNFCGRKYPLKWTHQIPTGQLVFETIPSPPGRWLVAMDAASLVSTSPLDLSSYPANFVAISFYKMFGFPTGLGALLVRRDCCGLLRKGYYGGGTVAATVSRERFHVHRAQLHERLEDGTVSFLSIAALSHGFDALTRIGRSMEDISTHTFTLAQYVYTSLAHLRHSNGSPVVIVYCHGRYADPSQQGPIINFNVLRSDGRVVGYSEVDKLACVYDIHLRTGCFCNTGACMRYLDVSAERVKEHLKAGHVCGDSVDLVNGEPTGTVRVSLGYMSTLHDVQTLLSFLKTCFVDTHTETVGGAPSIMPRREPAEQHLTENHEMSNGDSIMLRLGDHIEAFEKNSGLHDVGHLSQLTLYPIKSCNGQSVSSWPMGTKGLLYDREWMVVDERGAGLSLKQEVRLCHVKPVVDLLSDTLTLFATGQPPLVIGLGPDTGACSGHVSTRVCGDRVTPHTPR